MRRDKKMNNSSNKTYVDILKDSYNNPNVSISREQRYNLSTILLKTDRVSSDNILRIAGMLNRKPDDSYFIVYGLLMQYQDNSMENIESKTNKKLSLDDKSDALEESCQIISKNIQNKEFIDQIYKDIRLGNNIAKIYYPSQLKKDLIQLQNFSLMINKLKTAEKF